MGYRKIRNADFVGKVVAKVDSSAHNVTRFEFTDGTTLELWAESFHSLAGGIPGIFVDDDTVACDVDLETDTTEISA